MKKCAPTLLIGLLMPLSAFAQMVDTEPHDPIAPVLFWITLIFLLAIVGRSLAQKCHQPGVLGELLMGVLLGNICYFFGSELMVVLREGGAIFTIMRNLLTGDQLALAVHKSIASPHYAAEVQTALAGVYSVSYIKVAYVLDIFSRYGVIFLLFMTGLDSSFEELKHTGRESLTVAIIGVIAPIILGFSVACIVAPTASYTVNLFVAATLSATSIGITARVLSEMKQLHTREARTILGAAMIDDVLGLIILAIVSSMVISGTVDMYAITQTVSLTLLFFVGTLLLGPVVLRVLIRYCRFLTPSESKLFISFIFVMTLAWLATLSQLASIIGAFAAGMIINDHLFDENTPVHHGTKTPTIKTLLSPMESLLAPLFFMLIGMQVKLESFFDWQVLMMACGFIIAAIIGKLLSGLGGNPRDDRLLIGIGMLPRGEVGLVFASIGRTLGIMSDQLFSAIILMVIVTTFMAPPLLTARYARRAG